MVLLDHIVYAHKIGIRTVKSRDWNCEFETILYEGPGRENINFTHAEYIQSLKQSPLIILAHPEADCAPTVQNHNLYAVSLSP